MCSSDLTCVFPEVPEIFSPAAQSAGRSSGRSHRRPGTFRWAAWRSARGRTAWFSALRRRFQRYRPSGYSPHRRRTFSAFPFSPQPPDGTGNTGRFSAIKRTTVLMGRAAFSPWQFRSSPCIGRSCGFRHGRIPERCEDRLHAHAGCLGQAGFGRPAAVYFP